MNNTVSAIIDVYINSIYNEYEKEDLFTLSIPLLHKKLKNLNDQIIFLHAENRLLYNYLIWYQKRIIDEEQRDSENILLSNSQAFKHKIKQPLSIQKKRDIAETTFKVLLGYSQKYRSNATQYIDECINSLETDDETLVHLEHEFITLQKFNENSTAEEFIIFIHDRLRYQDTVNARNQQKTIRLHFQIDIVEKSIRKIRQLGDTVTDVDFEQLKIDIEKQMKELNMKNKMLIYYKRQQSEANMKLNATKPELFKEIRTLTSIRNEINHKIQQLNHYNHVKQKIFKEMNEYEKLNGPLHEMILSYRVPSIINYVDLKSKQINLHRQIQTWQRKVQLAEHELHLREIESMNNPEKIIHPWKYLQNPSPILFHQRIKLPSK